MSKYKAGSSIQQMAQRSRKERIAPTEYKNYDDYLKAQKQVHEHLHSKPAISCELCGYPLTYNGHKPTEREQKWSIHDVCQEKMSRMLDRETGIARERKALANQNTGKRF